MSVRNTSCGQCSQACNQYCTFIQATFVASDWIMHIPTTPDTEYLLRSITIIQRLHTHALQHNRLLLYNAKYKALYKQYGMKPWEALVVPLIQLPIFVSFYIGIGKMGLYCPGFEHGGLYWFTDLGAPASCLIEKQRTPYAHDMTPPTSNVAQ
eukprot:932-Heterococcus_DN1.PRE.3